MKATKRARKSPALKRSATQPSQRAAAAVRQQVRDLLSSSPGYQGLPPDRRKDIADHTVRIAAYLVDPHGLIAQEFRDPVLAGVVAAGTKARRRGHSLLLSDTIHMSSAAMDELVAAVDFPDFVSGLINGVFSAIVNASIRQMDAYAALVRSVSETVNAFIADTISDKAARDALVSDFPDVFCWTGTRLRRLKIHVHAGSPGLTRVAGAISLREPALDPKRPADLNRTVEAARRRLARNRQQTLSTMMLMGINRIVVTDGR